MSNFDDLVKTFTGIDELKAYCRSQHKTILELSKKINKLEQEAETLKSEISLAKTLSSNLPTVYKDATDAEIVCLEQLRKLKETAIGTELTLEEAKKVEIYARVLLSIRNRGKDTKDEKVDKLDNEQLMKLLSNPEDLHVISG